LALISIACWILLRHAHSWSLWVQRWALISAGAWALAWIPGLSGFFPGAGLTVAGILALAGITLFLRSKPDNPGLGNSGQSQSAWAAAPPIHLKLGLIDAALFAAALGMILWRVGFGLLAPVTGWDSLTYHLPQTASWLQTGHLMSDGPGPAWNYYIHFPAAGELLKATLVGWSGSTHAVVLMSFWALVGCGLGTGLIAHLLGARGPVPMLCGLLLATQPATLGWVSSGYVDSIGSACALCAVGLLLLRTFTPSTVLASMIAAGLAAAIKTSHVPLFVLLSMGWTVRVWQAPASRTRSWLMVGMGTIIAAGMNAGALGQLWQRGNLVYPFAIGSLPGLSPGEPGLIHLLSTPKEPTSWIWSIGKMVWNLFGNQSLAFSRPYLNLGPGMAVGMVAGSAGLLWRLGLRRRGEWRPLLCALVILLSVIPWFLNSSSGLRDGWVEVLGRFFVLPAAIVIAWFGAGTRWVPSYVVLLRVLVALHLLLSFPRGWAPTWNGWAIHGAVLLGLLLAACWLLSRIRRLTWTLTALPLLICAASFLDVTLIQERKAGSLAHIWGSFRSHPTTSVFDSHPLDEFGVQAVPVWLDLAYAPSQFVGVYSYPRFHGHNIFLGPLTGERMQHRVVPLRPKEAIPPHIDILVITDPLLDWVPPADSWTVTRRFSSGAPLLLERN
jgi:hypothetical protein